MTILIRPEQLTSSHAIYQGVCYIPCYVPLPLNVPLAGSPRDACAQNPAVFVPSSSGEYSEAPDERDLDWED